MWSERLLDRASGTRLNRKEAPSTISVRCDMHGQASMIADGSASFENAARSYQIC
jgi:hypothetical protein